MIAQIVAVMAMSIFKKISENPVEMYLDHTVFLTGLTGILAMFPAVFFYRRDQRKRDMAGTLPKLSRKYLPLRETGLLLLTGAGLAQYGNLLMLLLQGVISSEAYQESAARITEGKSIFMMIFWMGIVAPAAEEMIFRWLIYLRLRENLKMPMAALISGLIFGIYHGNMTQAVYALLLGMVFAYILEKSQNLYSSILLHMGANIWSLLVSEYVYSLLSIKHGSLTLIGIYALLLGAMVYCFGHYARSNNENS